MASFDPVVAPDARILIVGTWPSPKSRAQNFYYGHPQNRFWPLLARLLQAPEPVSVEEKRALILRSSLALWDTVASCTISGASDASIRDVVPNEIAALCAAHNIRQVLCNGATAYKLYCRFQKDAPPAVQLPSTSPANAAWSMERLAQAWGEYLP